MFPNHLGKPTEFVITHIPTKNNPRGIIITPDGKTAFAANSLDDSLTVIDLNTLDAIGRVDLLPETVQLAIRAAEEETREYSDHILNVAIGYLRMFLSLVTSVSSSSFACATSILSNGSLW